MKVTEIKQQVKRAGRFSIFIDGKYKFSLSAAELADLGLYTGQTISESQLSNLFGEAKLSQAKSGSFRLLSYRPRSRWEIEDYLKRKKYEPEIIENTLNFLEEKAFINDEQFAKQWIENRLLLKHTSIRKLKLELAQKKVAPETINMAVKNQAIDEVPILKDLIKKKRNQTKYQDDLKLMQYLSRQGYSYEKIQVALGRRCD